MTTTNEYGQRDRPRGAGLAAPAEPAAGDADRTSRHRRTARGGARRRAARGTLRRRGPVAVDLSPLGAPGLRASVGRLHRRHAVHPAVPQLRAPTAPSRGSRDPGYLRIEPTTGQVEIAGVLFARSLQRTAAATEAIHLTMRHAFDDLGYRRFEWKCDSSERALPAGGAPTRLPLRGPVPQPHDHQGPQPGHRLVLGDGRGVARGPDGARTLADPANFETWAANGARWQPDRAAAGAGTAALNQRAAVPST